MRALEGFNEAKHIGTNARTSNDDNSKNAIYIVLKGIELHFIIYCTAHSKG